MKKEKKRIKIGAHWYKVSWNYKFTERFDISGLSTHGIKEIYITDVDGNGRRYSESYIGTTFIHEIIHCVDEVYNGGKLDEETVKRLGEGLCQVLNDNKLLKWFPLSKILKIAGWKKK